MSKAIEDVLQMVRRYANTVGKVPKEAEVVEICDFGQELGFLFQTDDKYGNLYWCVDKQTNKFSTFVPNMDIKRFMARTILTE